MPLNFDQVKRYVSNDEGKSDGNGIGKLKLEELRSNLLTNEDDTGSLLELVKEKREKEKVEELRGLKIKHQQLRARRHKESMEIQKVMAELERRKQQELQLRLEKERIKQGLERVDKTHLGKLEAEKKQELEKLSKERRAVQEKEETIQHQVEELEKKIMEQEIIARKRKEEVEGALAKKQGSKYEQKNRKLMELALSHGKRSSDLQLQRSKLEQERLALDEQMTRLRGGTGKSDVGLSSPQSPDAVKEKDEIENLVNTVEQRIAEQQEKLIILKRQHDEETKEQSAVKISDDAETKLLKPHGINKSLPFVMEADTFLQEWLDKDPKQQMRSTAALAQANKELEKLAADTSSDEDEEPVVRERKQIKSFDLEPEQPKGRRNKSEEPHSEHETPTKKRHKAHTRSKGRLHKTGLEREIEDMKEEYHQAGTKDPELWDQIETLEAQLNEMRASRLYESHASPVSHFASHQSPPPMQGMSPHHHHPPIMYPQHVAMSPAPDPMMNYHILKQERLLEKQAREMKKLKRQTKKKRKKKSKHKKKRYNSSEDSGSSSSDRDSSCSDSSDEESRGYRRGRRHSRDPTSFGNNDDGEEHRKELEEQRQAFAKTMEGIAKKIRILNSGSGAANGSNAQVGQIGEGGRAVEKNQFMEGLETLEMIPKDSELYDIQVEHLKMMTKMRLEIDELKQKQVVASIKDDLERKHRETTKAAEFEEMKREQARQLELARMRRALAKEKSEMNWNGKAGAGQRPYDPQSGFVVYFDYILGIPKRFPVVRMVFCIYDGQKCKTPAKGLPQCETEEDSPTKQSAMLVARKKFQKVPALTSLRMVMELQCVVENPYGGKNYQSIGWTVLNLFSGDPTNLTDGPLKLAFRKPPFKLHELENFNSISPDEGHMTGFIRVIHGEDTEAASDFVVDPHVTQHLYSFPHERAKKEKKGKKKKAKREKRKQQEADDDVSDTASVAESVASAASGGAQSVATVTTAKDETGSRSDSRQGPKTTRRGYAVQIDEVSFEDESPPNPIHVRVSLLPNENCFATYEEDEKLLLGMQRAQSGDKASTKAGEDEEEEEAPKVQQPKSGGDFDFGDLKDGVHVWESIPRDIRLSSGQATWNKDAETNFTFFDGVKLEAGCLLLFKIYEKETTASDHESATSNPEDVDDEAELVAWGTLPLTNAEGHLDLHAKAYEIELIQPTVELPVNTDAVEWLNGKLKVRLLRERRNSLSKNSKSTSSVGTSRHRKKHAGSASSRISSIAEEEDAAELNSEMGSGEENSDSDIEDDSHKAWVERVHKLPDSLRPFVKDQDAFDVYIDGARHLPEYVTLSSVHVKLLTHSWDMIGENHTAYPRITDSAYSPRFRLRAEYRGEEIANPSATLLIRIDTVDRYSQKVGVIGYACLNVFAMPHGTEGEGDQPASSTVQEYVLNQGAFQLPLYQSQPTKQGDFNTKHMIDNNFFRVPCATVLVRIVPAKKSKDGLSIMSLEEVPEEEWEKRGLVIPAPDYLAISKKQKKKKQKPSNEGYDSSRCVPLPCEEHLYHHLQDREDMLVGEVSTYAKRSDVAEDQGVDVMEDDDLLAWIRGRLEGPEGMVNNQHIAPYQAETGFKVSIERITNVKAGGGWGGGGNMILKAIYSIYPPGSFYCDPKLTEDVQFTKSHDWKAPLVAPAFLDELFAFRDVPYDSRLVVIVDIKNMKPNKKKTGYVLEDYGWTVVPVFRDGTFVANGMHQLPLFEGKPKMSFLDDLQASEKEPFAFIQQELGKGAKTCRTKPLKSASSVFVKIVDDQIIDCIEISLNSEKQTHLVPKKEMPKYVYNHAKTVKSSKKTFASILSKKQNETDFEKNLNEEFAKLTEISHYTF